MDNHPIIIAGAGIAGLASALALGKRDVLMLEQASSLSELGAGLQLGPNAVRALQKLGAWDAVEPITSSPPEIHMRDGSSGKLLRRLPLGADFKQRYGTSYRTAHRADLHAALLQIAQAKANIQIRLNAKVSDVTINSNVVTLNAAGGPLSCHALIAADGVNSNIRQSLFLDTIARDSHVTHHRALILPPATASVDLHCVNVWMYQLGHVVHYPVGRQQRLNIVALTPRGTKPLVHFARAATPLQDLLQAADPHFTPWQGLYAPPLSTWTKNGAMLIGDAAHGTLPYLAQGAAMALEDAACLAEVIPTAQNLHHAFAETEKQRMPRTQRLHDETLKAGRIYHHTGFMRLARNATLVVAPRSSIARRLDWLYRG